VILRCSSKLEHDWQSSPALWNGSTLFGLVGILLCNKRLLPIRLCSRQNCSPGRHNRRAPTWRVWECGEQRHRVWPFV
jgi:hypothetical protein